MYNFFQYQWGMRTAIQGLNLGFFKNDKREVNEFSLKRSACNTDLSTMTESWQ